MNIHQGLAELCERYWVFRREEFPLAAFMAGQPMPEDALLRDAPADYERRAKAARSMMSELVQIPLHGLSVQERASHASLRRELGNLILDVEVKAYARPSLFPLGPEHHFTYLANATTLSSLTDAQRYNARLRLIPQALAGVRDSLNAGLECGIRYPALVTMRAADMVHGLAGAAVCESAFYSPFVRARGQFADAAHEAQSIITQEVTPALHDYAEFIAGPLSRVARDSIACTEAPLGHAYYAAQIERYATVADTPEAIHAVGLREVAMLREQMQEVAGTAGFPGDVLGFRRHIMANRGMIAASADALREQIEVLAKRIDARIPEFFGRTPRTTYGVRSIPAALAAKQPPAYAQPNPADNSAAGVYWVTSIPDRLPSYLHPAFTLHEAWPGHLMHVALIQEMTELPAFRRYGALHYSACLEGWALYCERLGEEMGMYDTPEKRYGRLDTEMWRACRLVVDTGIHAQGWQRDEAVAFMRANLALPTETIEAEVDRYIAWPAQALSYQLGNLAFRSARQQAEARLKEGFRIRKFHDAVISAGPVALSVLDEFMKEWIEVEACSLATA